MYSAIEPVTIDNSSKTSVAVDGVTVKTDLNKLKMNYTATGAVKLDDTGVNYSLGVDSNTMEINSSG